MEEDFGTKSEIRVITFDLDNTIWKTDKCIGAANDALAEFLSKEEIVQPERVEVVMGNLFRSNKAVYAPLDDENAKSPVLLTKLRTDAIRHILENHNTEKYSDLSTIEDFAKKSFEIWTEARHHAASKNFAKSVIECLTEISSSIQTTQGNQVLIGAITDGNSNPNIVKGLNDYFDFVVNAEMVGVSKPDKRVYLEAAKQHVFKHPSFDDIEISNLDADDELENAIGPYWVHIGDDFMKDVVAAKGLKMRTIWATELIRDKLKKEATNQKSSTEEEVPSTTTNNDEQDLKAFVKKMADKKTISMTLGDDYYLADSMREEYVDAIAEEFQHLSDILLDWHNEGTKNTAAAISKSNTAATSENVTPTVKVGGTTNAEKMSSLTEPSIDDIVTVVLPDEVSDDTTNGGGASSSKAKARAFRLIREDCTMDIPAPVENRESRTMQDVMVLAQMDKSSGVFAFPISDVEGLRIGKRVMMVNVGGTVLELSKDIFASMTVQEVLNFTDENPVTLSLYMKDASDAPSFDIF